MLHHSMGPNGLFASLPLLIVSLLFRDRGSRYELHGRQRRKDSSNGRIHDRHNWICHGSILLMILILMLVLRMMVVIILRLRCNGVINLLAALGCRQTLFRRGIHVNALHFGTPTSIRVLLVVNIQNRARSISWRWWGTAVSSVWTLAASRTRRYIPSTRSMLPLLLLRSHDSCLKVDVVSTFFRQSGKNAFNRGIRWIDFLGPTFCGISLLFVLLSLAHHVHGG